MAALLGACILGIPRHLEAQRQNFTFSPDTSTQVEAGGAGLPLTHWVEQEFHIQQKLMVHNRTDSMITVLSYTLKDCSGILLGQCRANSVTLAIPPHRTVHVGTIRENRLPGRWTYSYEIQYTTPADPSMVLALSGSVAS
jgi:hypothetical protein